MSKFEKCKGFDQQAKLFLDGCQDRLRRYFPVTSTVLELDELSRYVRVVRVTNQRSAYAFLEKSTGLIFKAASWKSPAKHARGSLFSPHAGMEAVSPDGIGIVYLN